MWIISRPVWNEKERKRIRSSPNAGVATVVTSLAKNGGRLVAQGGVEVVVGFLWYIRRRRDWRQWFLSLARRRVDGWGLCCSYLWQCWGSDGWKHYGERERRERIVDWKKNKLGREAGVFVNFAPDLFFILRLWNPSLFIEVEEEHFVFNGVKSWPFI